MGQELGQLEGTREGLLGRDPGQGLLLKEEEGCHREVLGGRLEDKGTGSGKEVLGQETEGLWEIEPALDQGKSGGTLLGLQVGN